MLEWLLRRFRGERRHAPRQNLEAEQAERRQSIVAQRLAKHFGTTPEELLDYRRADQILAHR